MALFFTILLLASAAGMVSLLWLKRYELRTGHVFFSRSRPRLGDFFSQSLIWVERVLPTLVAYELRRAYAYVRAWLKAAVAWIILATEGLLEHTLHLLRHKTSVPRHGGEASPFLREVAEHKKKLLQDREEE